MNSESGKMWMAMFVAYVLVVTWHLLGGAEENHENNHYSRSPGQDMLLRPEHKGLLLPVVQLCVVNVYSGMHPSGL